MAYAERLPSGQWRGVYRDLEGKRKYKAVGTHKNSWPTKKLALNWAREQETDVRRGQWHDPRSGSIRYRDWVESWWDGRDVEDTTRETDRDRVDKYLIGHWGETALSDISASAVRGWVTSLSKPAEKGGNGLGAWTVHRIYYMFRSSMELAVRDRKIHENPAEGVVLPTTPSGREVFFTQPQVEEIRAQMGNEVDRLVTLTLAWTGLRWGELAGLHADSVDLMREQIEVRRTLIEVEGRRYIKPYPKGKEPRIVPIAPVLLPALMDWLLNAPVARSCGFVHQQKERCPGGLLLAMPPLGCITSNTWGRDHWHPARRRAAAAMQVEACRRCDADGRDSNGEECTHKDVKTLLPYGRPHDLRHTFASWMLQAGLSLEYLQRLMGHESIKTTQKYAHWQPDNFDREREVMKAAGEHQKGQNVGQNSASSNVVDADRAAETP